MALNPENCVPEDVLGKAMGTMDVLTRGKRPALVDGIDPRAAGVWHGDRECLKQIAVNMVGNVITFTHEGELKLRVTVRSADSTGITLHFVVADTGIGIPPARKYGGVGLGLTIAARLIHVMKDRIWVKSEPGRGSRVHFTVRIASCVTECAPSQLRASCSRSVA